MPGFLQVHVRLRDRGILELIMIVYCNTFTNFMEVIEVSVNKGLHFTADVSALSVTYTGGF